MPNDRRSRAPLLGCLLAVTVVIVAAGLKAASYGLLGALGGGERLAVWLENGRLGQLVLFALLIGGLLGALWLIRGR